MEMRASQVIKGALGGGAKRKKKRERERDWGGETERWREERHLQIHTAGEVWRQECHSCSVTALNGADWTSSGAKVSFTLETFCSLRRRFSS